MSDSLTDKQRAFCKEYLKDFNATQAAIRAGYSEHTAKDIGCENLAKPNMQQYVKILADKMNERTDNQIERIITELQLIAFGTLVDVAEWDAFGLNLKKSQDLGDKARLISEISESRSEKTTTMKVKLYDKLKALELLGKYHKIFTDKSEQEITNKTIEVKLAYVEKD